LGSAMVSSFGFITFQKFKNQKDLILKRLYVLKMKNLLEKKKAMNYRGSLFE